MASGLDIGMAAAKSSLIVRQQELAIISNNVARANDKHFHKQSVIIANNQPVLGSDAYYGTGAHISQIVRQYDQSLENSLRQAKSNNSYNQTYADRIGQAEQLIGPKGKNPLNEAVQEFASSIQKVASNPESVADRTAFLGSAKNLSDQFNQQYENLRKIRDDIADDVTGSGNIQLKVNELNNLAAQLPELNDRIRELEQNAFRDQKANDLRDMRDAIVSKMSKLADITVTEGNDYRYTVRIGGQLFVDGTVGPPTQVYDVNLGMSASAPHNTPTITWASGPNAGGAVTLTSGEIDALIDSRAYVTTKMNELYTYAQQFGDWAAATPPYSSVNTAHIGGFDLDGNAGGRLFALNNASQPADGNILSVIITDPRDVAASNSNSEAGNGDNARDIWSAMDATQAALSQNSILDYSNRYLNDIAEDTRVAKLQAETSDAAESMFQDSVFELSGVNMDQQMTKMLEVQRAFQASAKVITTIDQMMQVVLTI